MKPKNTIPSDAPAAFGTWSNAWLLALRQSGAKLARIVSTTHLLALADQAIVSGASFVSTVLIARAGDPAELGIYALGFSVLTILISVQDTVVLTPYSIQRHQPVGTPEEHAGASLALSALLAGLTMLTFVAAASILSVLGIAPRMAAMAWALAVVVPSALLREFGRRYAFAHLRMSHALIQDIAVSALQIGALVWLYRSGGVTAVTATLALGVACLLTTLVWFLRARRHLTFRKERLRANLERSWRLGKWLLGSRLSVNVQGYVSYWLSTLIFGTAATGVYAACMSIVSFANPLIFGIGNVLTPRSALAWKKGGAPALWQAAINEALLLGAVVGAFCLIVGLVGDRMMQVLYRGPEFAGQGHTLVVLSLAMLALAISFPAASALATMERPRAILAVAVLAAGSTLVLVVALMAKWGLTGAAYGYFAGNVITAIGRWMAFYRALPASDTAPLASLLAELTQSDASGNWAITRLGEGDHATAFMVASRDGTPVWQGHERFVVKLFKPAAGLDLATAEMQFEALARLHRAVDGVVANGWTISAATPLHFSRMPLAIVMSDVRGKLFNSCGSEPVKLEEAAKALVAGMKQSWLRDQAHGDLGLQNVLFDLEGKAISLIDPGTIESCRCCNSPAKGRHAAALDLGHLLTDLTRELAHRIGTPAERRRRQFFIEKILAAAVADIGSREGKIKFLKEIAGTVETHLEDQASQAHGLKRVWHLVVRPIKRRCARSILEKITNELERLELPTGKAPSASTARIAA